jgi:hypothetical protein
MSLGRFELRKRRGGTVRKLVLGLTALSAVWRFAVPTISIAGELDYPPTDYTLRSIDGSQVIGRAHIAMTHSADGLATIHSEYHFLDGDYDKDDTTLRAGTDDGLPRLVRGHHVFFHPDGSLDRESRVDIAKGTGVCTIFENGKPQSSSAQFDFPADSYAGDAVIIPLHWYLRTGGKGSINFHDFNCIPGPKLLKVTGSASPSAPWSYYPGDLVRVDVEPDFGWIDAVISPFLPRIQAWFDQREGWFFVGGESARYYKGLKYLMVRERKTEAEIKAAPLPEPTVTPTAEAQPHP